METVIIGEKTLGLLKEQGGGLLVWRQGTGSYLPFIWIHDWVIEETLMSFFRLDKAVLCVGSTMVYIGVKV